MTVATLLKPSTTNLSAETERSRTRAKRILERKIEFKPCQSFDPANLPTDPQTDLDRIVTVSEELAMFRAMNNVKERATRLRKNLSPLEPSDELMDEIEILLASADKFRNRIVCIFMKLGTSIARKLSSARFPLDDLKSESCMTLLRAVDCFDCELGFRFSTYATHSVRRNVMRYITKHRKEKETHTSTENLDEVSETRKWTCGYEQQIVVATAILDDMMRRLEERDRFILRSRFGLVGDNTGQSLQRIADDLGVSRERVRQLERRAADRLRQMARQEHFEPLEA